MVVVAPPTEYWTTCHPALYVPAFVITFSMSTVSVPPVKEVATCCSYAVTVVAPEFWK